MTRQAARMLQRLRSYWFLFGIGLVVSVGLLGHGWLTALAELPWLTTAIAFTVIAMMAAPIPLEMVRQAVGRPWPAVLASLINLGVIPMMGWAASRFLSDDMAGGLIVASAVPSTLTSAAVMVRTAGGDHTVSIFTTLITNILCVVITPLWIILLLGVSVDLRMTDMVANLSLVVLLPIVLVQTLRWRSGSFCRMAESYRNVLSILCQIGILMMVLIGAIQMGTRWSVQSIDSPTGGSESVDLWQLAAVILLGLLIHLAAFGLAWVASAATGISRPQAKAVSFSGSQKTLMIGLNLAVHCGVSILPIVTYHIFQLVVDAFIAERWSQQPDSSDSDVEIR